MLLLLMLVLLLLLRFSSPPPPLLHRGVVPVVLHALRRDARQRPMLGGVVLMVILGWLASAVVAAVAAAGESGAALGLRKRLRMCLALLLELATQVLCQELDAQLRLAAHGLDDGADAALQLLHDDRPEFHDLGLPRRPLHVQALRQLPQRRQHLGVGGRGRCCRGLVGAQVPSLHEHLQHVLDIIHAPVHVVHLHRALLHLPRQGLGQLRRGGAEVGLRLLGQCRWNALQIFCL
mmetsp:Transcript_79155/g.226968  ORF Transcript_79155/g.226968 Transcript_79155/m.226968 type:complete len:235 (-) Transcript_79155:475-1179(-)